MGKAQKNIRIGLLDDHLGFMEMAASVINNRQGMKVVLMATGIEVLMHKLQSKTLDILLLDLSLRAPQNGRVQVDGDKVIQKLADKYPDIKVIIYSLHNEAELMASMMDKGARGYLCKSADVAELETALCKVAETGWYFNDAVSLAMNKRMKRQGRVSRRSGPLGRYNENELSCWRYMVSGLTIKETAAKMHKSPSAVKGYRRSLKKKTGCTNTAELISLGIELGLGSKQLA